MPWSGLCPEYTFDTHCCPHGNGIWKFVAAVADVLPRATTPEMVPAATRPPMATLVMSFFMVVPLA